MVEKPAPHRTRGAGFSKRGKGVNLYRKICQVEVFVAQMTINEDPRGNWKLQKSRIRDVPPYARDYSLGYKDPNSKRQKNIS